MKFANPAQRDAFVQQYGQAAAAGGRPQSSLSPAGQGGAIPRPPGTTDAQYQSMLNALPLPPPGAAGNSLYDRVRTQSAVQTPRQQMEQRDRLRAQARADSAGQRSQSIFSRPGIDLQRRGSPQPPQPGSYIDLPPGMPQQPIMPDRPIMPMPTMPQQPFSYTFDERYRPRPDLGNIAPAVANPTQMPISQTGGNMSGFQSQTPNSQVEALSAMLRSGPGLQPAGGGALPRPPAQPAMAKGGKVAKYAKGGSVRGAGCETRGLRKARIY